MVPDHESVLLHVIIMQIRLIYAFSISLYCQRTAKYNNFICRKPKPPALAFDAVPDYTAEYVLRGMDPELL